MLEEKKKKAIFFLCQCDEVARICQVFILMDLTKTDVIILLFLGLQLMIYVFVIDSSVSYCLD